MASKTKALKMPKKIDRKKKLKQIHKPKVERTSPQQYLKEVRLELKKVAWPSRQEVITFTIIVLVVVVIFGIYTGLLDAFFQYLIKLSTELKS